MIQWRRVRSGPAVLSSLTECDACHRVTQHGGDQDQSEQDQPAFQRRILRPSVVVVNGAEASC